MATLATTNPRTPDDPIEDEPVNYLNVAHGWKSWLLTVDHKRIALLYLFSITAMFFIGGAFAILVRLHLTTPNGLFSPEVYNRLILDARHCHGVLLPGSLNTRDSRKFSAPNHDRRKRSCVSPDKLVELVYLCRRRISCDICGRARRR